MKGGRIGMIWINHFKYVGQYLDFKTLKELPGLGIKLYFLALSLILDGCLNFLIPDIVINTTYANSGLYENGGDRYI